MLILPLPLLGLGSKSTSLSPGFSVRRPRQYNTICSELNLISGFFAFFWFIVWADGINKCGCYLAGSRGCWLKGPHQIPSVSWIFYHSLHFRIYQIVSYVPRILCPLCCYYKWWWDGIDGGGWFISGCGWGDRGGYYLIVFFFTCAFVLFSHVLSLFKWVDHDSCCVCFFVYYLFSFSPASLTRSYWGIKIVVSVM